MHTDTGSNPRRALGVAITIASLLVACGSPAPRDASDSDAASRQVAIGDQYEHGRGVVADLTRAREAYGAACDAGNMRGCAALAFALTIGPRLGRQTDVALDLARRACDAGDLLGCTNYALTMAYLSSDERTPASEVELHRRACDGGELVGCRRLASAYVRGTGVEPDFERAATIYRDACARHDGPSCTSLGELNWPELGVEEHRVRALTFFLAGCDAGDGDGCARAGFAMLESAAADGNLALATARLRQGCDFGDGSACRVLGVLFVEGAAVELDLSAGTELFERGCAYGDAYACDVLGEVYVGHFGGTAQPARAADAYDRGCDEGLGVACFHLAEMLAAGAGVDADPEAAAALFEIACGEGIASACVDPDPEASAALRAWEDACVTDHDAEACWEAGHRYQYGAGVDSDLDRALELYRMSCNEGRGNMEGCFRLGDALSEMEEDHLAEAVEAWGYACDADVREACVPIAEVYAVGAEGVPVDVARARSMLTEACERGVEEGCERFALVLSDWAFAEELRADARPNRARAQALYGEACRAEPSSAGCFQLARLRAVPDSAVHTYRIELTSVVRGPSWLRVGQQCEIVVKPRESDEYSFIRATCGGRPIYPTASEIIVGDELAIEDTATTREDGDAELRIDLDAGTFVLRDDEDGALGDLELAGRVTTGPR